MTKSCWTIIALFLTIQMATCQVEVEDKVIQPLLIEKDTYSGLSLKRVTNPTDPERILFQKMLFSGKEIMVFVVASETKTAVWKDYGIEEFIHVLNGRARLNPDGAVERYYRTGDNFIAPVGYNGEWETQGGESYFYELSVIVKDRTNAKAIDDKRIPVSIDRDLLSGIGITSANGDTDYYRDVIYEGAQIDLNLYAEKGKEVVMDGSQKEQLIGLVAGTLTIETTDGGRHTYYKGDWVVLPANLTGTWTSQGHELFRYIGVTRAY